MIVAFDRDENIGKEGKMPWPHLKQDLQNFKNLTTRSNPYSAVLMGRKTWESLPERHRPLKDRFNIVVSETMVDGEEDYCSVVKTVKDGVELARLMNMKELWIIGGNRVYTSAFYSDIFINAIYATEIKNTFEGCDTKFPVGLLHGRYSIDERSEDFKEGEIVYKITKYIPND